MAQPQAQQRLQPGQILLSQVAKECPIDFKAAAAMFGRNPKPDRALLYRWRSVGCLVNGATVYLGWYREGGTILTTKEAVERFQLATNGE